MSSSPAQFTLADLAGRDFATVAEAARVLHVDPRTVRRAIASGDIPATRVGSDYRLPVLWLRARAQGVAGSLGKPAGGAA